MKRRLSRPLLLVSLTSLLFPTASTWAQTFPEAMDYVMQLQSSIQSNDNPGRLSENMGKADSSNILINSVGLAARIPLLSDQTRLDIAGLIGDARFNGANQLNYQPRHLDTTLHWRAGRLVSGQMQYQYRHKRHESDRIWPESDTITTRRWSSAVGLNVSDGLTLPSVKLYEERTGYGALPNQQLYDRTEKGWEVSARYDSTSGSSASLGWRQSRTELPQRHTLARTDLDDAYRDQEVFAQVYWRYSIKTALLLRTGWLQRRYATFSERNTQLLTLDAQAFWQYSPKTELILGLWQRPFSNDEDPSITYSTFRGVGLTANWEASPKLAFSLKASYETQEDTRLDNSRVSSPLVRFGPRLTWRAHPNLDVILDGYHVRKSGTDSWNRYRQNVVRLGLVIYTGSTNHHDDKGLGNMLGQASCGWNYQEAQLCP